METKKKLHIISPSFIRIYYYSVASHPRFLQKQVLLYDMIPFIAEIPPVSPIIQTEGSFHKNAPQVVLWAFVVSNLFTSE